MHFYLDLFRLQRDMAENRRNDIIAEKTQEIGFGAERAFMREQNREAFARNRRGTWCGASPIVALAPVFPPEDAHAAFRPKSLPNRCFGSLWIVIGTFSPSRRRIASW